VLSSTALTKETTKSFEKVTPKSDGSFSSTEGGDYVQINKPLKYEGVTNGLIQFIQYLLGRHMTVRSGQVALSWLRRTTETIPQLAGTGRRPGDAEGLRRRPATNEDNDDRVSQEPEIRVKEGSNVEQEVENTGDAHNRRFSLQKFRVVKK